MNNNLKKGDEVLIFRYVPSWGANQNYKVYLRGKVISYELSDDISHHGSAQFVMNYVVEDENGDKHYGNYYYPHLGDSFFLTEEDYINHLKGMINTNNGKIEEIKKENDEIGRLIEGVKGQKVVRSRKKNGDN